jgi:hypothetical protein
MKPLAVLCFAVLCITLTLGLWPFHAPANEVTRLKGSGGLAFGRHGTVLSRGPLKSAGSSGSVEIWSQPKRWTGSTLLTLYRPDKHLAFELRQSLEDLEPSVEAPGGKSHFYVGDALGPSLREKKPVLITVVCGSRGTVVYRDGALAMAPGFLVPGDVFAGWLVVGDSVGETHSFRGDIFGLAIYDREVNAAEAMLHYQSWKKNGRPGAVPDTRDASEIALYLFDEKTGNAVRNHAAADTELYIPGTYTVVDQIFLRPLWEEFAFSRSYWTGNLKNIVGFIPTGFCFYAYLAVAWPARRALLVTVVLGFLVSLTIEVLQAYLPTRDSGMTDLITNTLGTYLGILCYRQFSLRFVGSSLLDLAKKHPLPIRQGM